MDPGKKARESTGDWNRIARAKWSWPRPRRSLGWTRPGELKRGVKLDEEEHKQKMAAAFVKSLGLLQAYEKWRHTPRNGDGEEGAAATSGGSAASGDHLRTEDTEDTDDSGPASKKAKGGETKEERAPYITVS